LTRLSAALDDVVRQRHIERLSFVRRAREIGFSIDEIKELLILAEPGWASCAEVQKLTTTHLDEVRAMIADLLKLERILANALERCSGKTTPGCPVLNVLGSARIS